MIDPDWAPYIYAAVMLTAGVACSLLLRRSQKDLGLPASTRLLIGLSAFVGAMLGAKLPFVLADDRGPFSLAWLGHGKTILCGLIGGYLAVEGAKWLLDVRTRLGDSYAIPVAVAVAIGRVGCFVVGCCFGTATDLPWGVTFRWAADHGTLPRHPTQLYEAGFHALMVVVLSALRARGWLVGQQLKAYLLTYLAYRFATEFIRPEAEVFAGLTAYQWGSLALVPVFVGLWIKDRRDPRPPRGTPARQGGSGPASGPSGAADGSASGGPSADPAGGSGSIVRV